MPLHLRRARTTRVSLEANGSMCRGMLRHRYDTDGVASARARDNAVTSQTSTFP